MIFLVIIKMLRGLFVSVILILMHLMAIFCLDLSPGILTSGHLDSFAPDAIVPSFVNGLHSNVRYTFKFRPSQNAQNIAIQFPPAFTEFNATEYTRFNWI